MSAVLSRQISLGVRVSRIPCDAPTSDFLKYLETERREVEGRRCYRVTALELDLSIIDRMRIAYDGQAYRLTDFDLQNLRILDESFSLPERGVAIFSPVPTSLLVLSCITMPAMALKHSMQVRSQSTYRDLHKGDLVSLRGLVGRYDGVREGRVYIWFANGLCYGMPLEMAWKLTKYEGRVRRLSRFDRLARRDGSREIAVLQSILGLEDERLPPFFTSRLIVVSSKSETYEHLRKVTVNGTPWSSVFPAAYYAKANSRASFGLDPLRRSPVILFTSKLETALALNRKVRADAIAIAGPSRLIGYYLDLEKEMRNGTAVTLIGDSKRWDRREIEQLRTLGFRVSVWNSRNARAFTIRRSDDLSDTVLHRSSRVMRNLAWAKMSIFEVASRDCDNLSKIRDLIYGVGKHSHSAEADRFVLAARQLLLSLACLPVPRAHCQQLHSRDQELLVRLKTAGIQARVTVSDRVSGLIEKTVVLAEEALDSCHGCHPKEEQFLQRAALLTEGSLIIARTREDRVLLSKWLEGHGLQPRVACITDVMRRLVPGNTALLPGWWGGRQSRLEYSGLFAAFEVVLLPYERKWYEGQKEYEVRLLESASGSAPGSGASWDGDSPDNLDEIIERVTNRLYETGADTLSTLPMTEVVVKATPVRFGSDCCAFLALGYRCRCIDFDADKIIVKAPSEIEPGDVLVFVKDSADDIFDRLVAAVKESSATMAEMVRLASLWKDALLESISGATSGVRVIQQRLRSAGVERSSAAIRRWLTDDDMIGPEDDAIRAIAEFADHVELRKRLEDVLDACRRIRALHVRLGRYLAAAIVSSVVGDETDVEDGKLASIVKDLSDHAEAVTVLSVANEAIDVPVSKTNRLLDVAI